MRERPWRRVSHFLADSTHSARGESTVHRSSQSSCAARVPRGLDRERGSSRLLRARAAHAQPSFWPPLQPRGTQPKDATRHLRGSACQRSPHARLRRPAAPGARARPVCRSDEESVVVRFVQADLMRRRSGCELVSLGRAFHTLGRSLVEGDIDLTACYRRSVRWISGAPRRKPQCSNRHDRSSFRRSASSVGAVKQTHPVADHARALRSAQERSGVLARVGWRLSSP